jgi:hypothetical protein
MENKLSTLAEDFSLENLESYLLDKGFTVDVEPVHDIQDIEEKYKVSDIKEIGRIRLKQEADLVVFAIKIDNLTERTSKKNQFDIAKRLLDKYLKFYGLFVFYDDNKNFRLSFVFKTTHGTKAKYSHYKRFTFYVNPNLPNKTFTKQLKDCDFTDLDSIKQAFSTQPITRDFYNDLQNWYYYALDKVKFPDDYKYSDDPEKDREIRNALSLIRLLTRLIFIWFLKEKGLVPSKLFDEKELKNIVKDFGKGDNYHNAILQNLFFATLNRPIKDRGWAEDKGFPANKKDFGVKSLYRYENKFLISKEEVLKLFEDIPFINGGLFDCLDKDKVYIDGFSRNEKKQAKISDELFFSSEEKTVDLSKYGLSKNAKVIGLIDILKSYNFTTDEATPIDQEIALDPELLGKVFENLLASYNPETETTARKATGSYYTPREIVDYMVEESLREYLKTKVPEAQDILDDLFSYSDEESNNISDDLKRKLIEAIDQIKIIDPACGSGAFPMGILHKLVFLLQKLDPSNKVWYEIQVDRINKESKEVLEIAKDENTLKELLNEVKEHFDESINYPDYARKLYLIENCIYGVDIQPIAIQISKLRFFISLILDQKVDKNNPDNFGILPLPNLETKFISANALIGLEKPNQKSLRSQEIIRLEQELKFLRHRYFRIKSRAEKIQLQNKDRELREKLKNALIGDGWNDKVAEKIAKFDIFDQNASADWFDPEWMFGVVDGFDIVIGNPPHGADIKKYKDYIEDHYRFYETRKNSASLFIEKGFNLLEEKGVLSYVIPKSITYVDSWERTRKVVYKENKLLTLIDISKAFENVRLEQVILISQKIKEKSYFYKAGDFWNDRIEIINDVNSEIIEKLEILPIYIDEIKLEILKKLMQDSIKLYNISETFRGLPFQRKISDTGYPILRGKNINKYQIYREIDKVKLTKSELNSARVKKYMRPKIISQNIVAHVMKPFDRIIIMATYDKEGYLTLDTVMNTFLKDKSFSYEYILGILNSRLAEWFYYWFVYNRAIRTMHFDEGYLGKLPIKKINSKNQPIVDQIIQKVDQILTLTQSEDYDTNQEKQKHVKRLEHEIDQLLYQLYNLTDEEIKIIENS